MFLRFYKLGLLNKQQKQGLVLFLLAIFSAFVFNFLNRSALLHDAVLLREGVTVVTADDLSYLVPAENFLAGNGWKTNQAGKVAYTLRSPGYGAIYGFFRLFLPLRAALWVLVVFQVVLFASAVAVVPRLFNNLFLKINGRSALETVGFILGCFIAVMPMFSGFLFYTLTEGVTPALSILFLYFLFRDDVKKRGIAAGVTLGLLIFIRPAMVFWILSVFVLYGFAFRRKAVQIVIFGLFPILIWQGYISIKTNELQSLHPIYQNDANDLYRPLHKSIWNFHKSWGHSGYGFNSTVNTLWNDALNHKQPDKTISEIMDAIPPEVINVIGQTELEKAYALYFEILTKQVYYYENHLPIQEPIANEEELQYEFIDFTKTYRSHYPIHSTILIPVKVYFKMAAHSNLSLHIFQKSWRNNLLMEGLRYISFVVHLSVFLLFPIVVITSIRYREILALSLPIGMYLSYLCFIQRGLEERYTLPVLIPMLMVTVGVGVHFYVKNKLR